MTISPDLKWKKWDVSPAIDPGVYNALTDYLPIFRTILYNRGITTAKAAQDYLFGTDFVLPDPYLLLGMTKAVDRIYVAINQNENIIVYGDYDVDGVTATALLVELLKGLGAEVKAYIPDRFEEGYGLNTEALKSFHESGVKLVITVDCGIRSMVEADFANEIGLDLIITDHHHPLDSVPEAFAVINPKQKGDEYPSKDLAGVGVALKLAQAVLLRTGAPTGYAERWLDLVALGTVADLAPLVGENRVLVRSGLQVIRSGRRLGLKELAKVAVLPIANTSASDIGFTLGPRLNAAGRLKTAMDAFELLECTDPIKVTELANNLNKSNIERQEMTRETQQKAVEAITTSLESDFILFVVDPDFNEGIVGLAASRLADQFYRPAVVGKMDVDTTRCSCRSIPEFHITNALDECQDLLIRHGGHAAAAGFTVANQNLDELIKRLKEIAHRELNTLDLIPTIHADAVVTFKDLTMDLFKNLELLQPIGYGNQEPYFICKAVQVVAKRPIGAELKHLKMTLQQGLIKFDAIAFGFGYLAETISDQIDILFSFEKNTYNGYSNLQLKLKDIHPSQK